MRTLVAMLALTVASAAHAGLTSAQVCEQAVTKGLRKCLTKVAKAERQCYLDTGTTCADTHPRVVAGLDKAASLITSECPDAQTVQDAGFGPSLTPAAMVGRVQEACRGEIASISARTFGGPHAAVLSTASPTDAKCLGKAHGFATKQLGKQLKTQAGCIKQDRKGATCNLATTSAKVDALTAKTALKVASSCTDIASLIGVDPTDYAERAAVQARCAVATTHADSGPLALDCGPRAGVPVPARETWTQVVLDEGVWGTRCGDGSPYAFWVRLAPNGSPVDNVLLDLQGGGVCIFGNDCAGVSSSLFMATDDGPPGGGYQSNDPAINPFHDWTRVFLPYCTQDVFIGGGLTNDFPADGVTVHRYGAINTRAAIRYVRDVVWAEMDATTSDGYRPDEQRTIFAGLSAGAFGVSYNFHYLLDDLRWPRTTIVPDSALALDNPDGLGIADLEIILNATTGALAWGTVPFQPPYCIGMGCAVVLDGQVISSPRLLAVPEQRILNVSNQVDNVQVGTTFFADLPTWTNTLRESYCDKKGVGGAHYFLSADSSSIHTMLHSTTRFTTVTAGGQTLKSWLTDAIFDPASTANVVDEGTLVADHPGVAAFPCSIP